MDRARAGRLILQRGWLSEQPAMDAAIHEALGDFVARCMEQGGSPLD